MTATIAPLVAVAPSKPDEAVIREAVHTLAAGGVIAFPTDTLYGIGCQFGQDTAIERIQKMRQFEKANRPLTFLLPDIGMLAHWAVVNENAYRILNRIFPGPYCAELEATARVPAPFTRAERRTIGVRIPDNRLCVRILWGLGRPILTATAKSRLGTVLHTAPEIQKEYGAELDLILDGGSLSGPPSTVVSLADDWVTVLREGRGPANKILQG
jgi:tRNA threonylcarbamoyl adenosine modification protein (Sua5/YciO/YrdC/YwlC family)